MSTPDASPAPPATSLIEPPTSEDDEPTIHPFLQRYITALTDSHTTYARFFSALLIPQDSHPQFFLDLKQFRQQPTIIYLLSPGTSGKYREVTRNFIGSRFAHPWCRVQSDFGNGWHKASWVGKTGTKEREKVKKEEERLHRLLVPIWIAMRRRMFPGDQVIKEWIEKDDVKEAERAKLREENASKPKSEAEYSTVGTTVYPELGFAIQSGKGSPASTASEPTDPAAVEAASKMFLGVAVTGFIMSDKRVKKYVKKKWLKK